MAGWPQDQRDVVVVAANRWAYDCFWKYSAYICQAGRSFRPDVDRLGYYAKGAIQCEFPTILARRDHVDLTPQSVRDLRASGDAQDAQFADVVERLVADGHCDRAEQIFLVTGAEDPRTLRIAHPIRNSERAPSGRRIAWVRGHRYVPEAALLAAPQTTGELAARIAGETLREEE